MIGNYFFWLCLLSSVIQLSQGRRRVKADMFAVSCGNHHAMSCADCTQGNGPSWCNGDCKYYRGQCVSKGTTSTTTTSTTTTTTVTTLTTTTTTTTTTDIFNIFNGLDQNATIPAFGVKYIRIVGGQKAPRPIEYQVLLSVRVLFEDGPGLASCGGTILDEETILSAAHCFLPKVDEDGNVVSLSDPKAITSDDSILAGTTTPWWIPGWRNSGQYIKMKQIITHPNYDSRTSDNDIAIVKLASPLSFNGDVENAALPPFKSFRPDEPGQFRRVLAMISGWGDIREDGPSSDTLRLAFVPLMTNSVCAGPDNFTPNPITSNMICAGFLQGGVDSCQGDSGGPLVVDGPDGMTDTVVGVVSFGAGCARPNSPGVYARVTEYLPWIKANMKGCSNPQWKGDGFCDDGNNNSGCDYDGGDCCGNVNTQFCIICNCKQ